MADLVIRDDASLLLVHHAVFLLLADQNHLDRLKEILLAHGLPSVLDRENRRLVDHVRELRADRPARRETDCIKVHRVIEHDILGVHLQNFDSAL